MGSIAQLREFTKLSRASHVDTEAGIISGLAIIGPNPPTAAPTPTPAYATPATCTKT
jgi:hypothetical protein